MVWYNIFRIILVLSEKTGRMGETMAFDAGMLACVAAEIRRVGLGSRVEKVFQPEKDEIVLQLRSAEGGRRLLINAGSSCPRISMTEAQRENPMTPPMLCMLLRKHLQGARLSEVGQEGFERVLSLRFETRDEMGFPCARYLIAEIMGKYSNLIFTDEQKKVITLLHPVDFTTSSRRQLLPGMLYELPPKQEKTDPTTITEIDFHALMETANRDLSCERWIGQTFLGISAAVAREIAYRACHALDVPLANASGKALSNAFFEVMDSIKSETFSPCMVMDGEKPVEYAFCLLSHYGDRTVRRFESAGALLDAFFGERDRELHIRQRAADILRLLTAADSRIRKKLDLQRGELAACERGAEYKENADLITANLHMLSRGMTRVELTDYADYREDGSFGVRVIELDPRLSPVANAQRFYKRYNKTKTARVELTRQIELGEAELRYLDSVFDALTHAETSADLGEIREELARAGYASRMKQYAPSKKPTAPAVAEFRTSGGYRVLCGKNNLQNEYITHRLAGKNDYWFHIKGMAGSHVVLICNGEEPPERDFTEAAEIAAFYSKGADGQNVEVDYTLVRNVKKPAGGKPGLVIYHTNWSCIVTPDEDLVKKLREK